MIPDELSVSTRGTRTSDKSSINSGRRVNYGATSSTDMAESASVASTESRIHARIVEAKYQRQFEEGDVLPEYLQHSNGIRTTKYTAITFLPKNLFEQFHRVANIYFLTIVILNWVPQLNALQPYLAMTPLLFVLAVTAIKDIVEDRRRYLNDRDVNRRSAAVYNSKTGAYDSVLWQNVCVGDVVEIKCDDVFPADLVLIHSSDRVTNLCYVETSNLDGETNLKQRVVPKTLITPDGDSFDPSKFKARVHCENPHHQIYSFTGYLQIPEKTTNTPLTKDNLLLRGCALRNTRSVLGLVVYTGHETKAMLNNSGPPSKRSKLERAINKEIVWLIGILAILCSIGAIGNRVWTGARDYRNTIYLPGSDLELNSDATLIFLVLVIALQVLVPISLYVSVEFVKVFQVLFLHWDKHFFSARTNKRLICRALNLNEDLGQIQYIFSDKTGTLTENEMIFRRCSINGIEYPHSPDVSPTPNIRNAPAMSVAQRRALGPDSNASVPADYKLVQRLELSQPGSIEEEFLLVLALCNTVVTSERTPTSNGGTKSATPSPDKPASASVYEAESPDELALVLAAHAYDYVLIKRSVDTVTIRVPDGSLVCYDVLNVLHFDSTRKRMSVIVRRQGTDKLKLLTKGADSAIYSCFNHPSGAGSFTRSVSLPEDELCTTPPIEETRADATQRQLDMYGRQGLRTLCMGSRDVSVDEYGAWLQEHEEAECAATNREELLRLSACRIEQNLELLGATGIEDRLQDHVAETIAGLRAAGINVWVLTGDKQETAINVSYSCQLIDEDMEVIVLNATTQAQCEERLLARLEELNLQRAFRHPRKFSSHPAISFIFPVGNSKGQVSFAASTTSNRHVQRQRALVVDGKTLQFLLTDSLKLDFLQLASQCRSVVCCRSTPLQKASVVGLVRQELNVMSLAVGDGANDVSMIQMANTGVGISGVEGQQAVMASDFAISRFHYLHRLLLVHGHWCYDRISRMILFFYYKNALFVLLIFWFQLFNGWSGSVAIEDLYLLLYNLVFTSVPPIVTAVLDQNIPPEVLLARPALYSESQSDSIYNKKHFFITMADAVWQSLALFFVSFLAYSDSNVGVLEFGTTQNTACILTVTLHLLIETQYVTWIHHLSMWGSLVVYLATGLVYNVLPGVPPYFVMEHTISTVEFWAVVVLSTAIALFPRFFTRAVIGSFRPSPCLVARMASTKKT
ncbi:phospholipid-transporting ATPase VA-like [Sycon ciliatum]|uniref:phospholipid-transporting ATPase VA-like n=1 Tax=Sycon ciliatum TaxID=27933 RepID=UPI0031F6BE90